jgi:opacity protein-like surface antigen/outer membrane protein OmpA-like peptidoglycan-associated protein
MLRTTCVVIVLASLAMGGSAAAQVPQEATIPAQLFEPAMGPSPFFTVEAGEAPGHKLLGLSLFLNYQAKPFRIANVNGTSIGDETYAVKGQTWADLVGALGLGSRYMVGVALPIALTTKGTHFGTDEGLGQPGNIKGAGIGDLRLQFKAVVWRKRTQTQSLALSAAPILTIPLSPSGYASSNADLAKREFLGERYPTFRPRANFEFNQGPLHAAANVGFIFRAKSTYLNDTLSQQWTYGAGVGYDLGKKITVRPVIELSGRHGFDTYQDTAPLELLGGVKVVVARMWEVSAGAGTALIGGIGAPQWRGFVGLSFNPNFRDRDGDGVPDVYDACPDTREDKDGYKDADGCPEPDNDGDGIADARDRCPNDPEDFDGFQDEDGCPDLDNDHDGIPDIRDACPFDPEDGRPPKPDDGCPYDKTDTDGDGIMDNVDKCPEEPEDMDGFQDEDGCPDPDNDNDGVPDQFDQCPNDPEDIDNFEDDDGCPDPDNDRDGVLDQDDKCPNQPETINGFQDEDGCPDKGEVKVILKDKENRIELKERIHFREKPGEVTIGVSSHSLLTQLAQVLRGHWEIAKLKITAHGGPNDSKETMARRAAAVRMFLIGKGIAPSRVVAALGGTGGTRAKIELTIEARQKRIKMALPGTAAPAGGGEGDAAKSPE